MYIRWLFAAPLLTATPDVLHSVERWGWGPQAIVSWRSSCSVADRHVRYGDSEARTYKKFGTVWVGESYLFLFFIPARNVCLNSFVAKPADREIPASDGGVAGC